MTRNHNNLWTESSLSREFQFSPLKVHAQRLSSCFTSYRLKIFSATELSRFRSLCYDVDVASSGPSPFSSEEKRGKLERGKRCKGHSRKNVNNLRVLWMLQMCVINILIFIFTSEGEGWKMENFIWRA